MADMAADNIFDEQHGKSDADDREHEHHDIAPERRESSHARDGKTCIMHECLERHGSQTRKQTHKHSEQEHKSVLAEVAQPPSVDFAIEIHFFQKNRLQKYEK
jgi:hypothetical protein